MGVRVNAPVNDRFAVNYWLVNGTNQVEATNGFKDEIIGFTAKPHKSVTWTFNYYFGQDHPDRTVVPPTGPIPVQPGLSFQAIRPAPDGRTHIFDSYVTWQATPKLTLAVSACESAPFAISTDVKERDKFWLKSQPYSLRHMLDGLFVDEFIDGTVYQAFLSPENYHRWHSPVSGTIKKIHKVEGTYYS